MTVALHVHAAVIAALAAEVDAGRHEFTPSPADPQRCCARVPVAGVLPCHRVETDRVHMTSFRIICALEAEASGRPS